MVLSAQRVQARLRGVAAGLLTPFDEALEVEHGHLEDNARALYGAGIRTFLAVANISEYHSLSRDERIDVAATCVDALPADACVLGGVGGPTADAEALAGDYERIGVDALMIMPPDHTYVHERGLLEYYRRLAAATDRPLVPYVRDVDPSVAFLADLTRIDAVVGVKYALPDAVKLGEAVAAGSDDVVWVNGLAEPFAVTAWAEGAEGFSAGVSNFRPDVGLALYDALAAGNVERARKLRNVCLPFQHFREERGEDNQLDGAISVPAVKKGLDLAGLHGGHVREPIRPLSPAAERRASELYDRLDDEIDVLLE